MAVAFVQVAGNNTLTPVTSLSAAYGSANSAGNLLIAAVSWGGAGTCTVTDSAGNTWAAAGTYHDATNDQSLGIFYAKNSAAGANTVTASFGASTNYIWIAAHEYSGLDTTAPLDQHPAFTNTSATNATDNAASSSCTPTTNGQLIFGACMEDGNGTSTPTAGTGYNQRIVQFHSLSTEDKVQATAAAVTATWTMSASTPSYMAGIATFKAAGTGGTAYTKTQADSVGITDTAARVAADSRSQADPVAITDTPGPQVLNVTLSLADSEGITDAATTAVTAPRTQADPVGLADTTTAALTAARTPTAPVGITDAVVVDFTSTGASSVSDPVDLTDQASTSLTAGRTQADGVGLTDAVLAQLDRVVTVADLLALTDTPTADLAGVGTQNLDDPTGITDGTTWAATWERTPSEPVGVTDTAVAVLERVYVATIDDAVGVLDAVTKVTTTPGDGTAVRNPTLTLTTPASTLTITTPASTLELT